MTISPAPWKTANGRAGARKVFSADGWLIADYDTPAMMANTCAAANARVGAAAPELLEALKGMLQCVLEGNRDNITPEGR